MPSFRAGASLGDALARSLTGRSAGFSARLASRPLGEQLAWLEKQAGGVGKAASAAGVAGSTWRRWKSGSTRQPKPESLAKVQRAQREALIPTGRRDRMGKSTRAGEPLTAERPPTGGATLTGTVTVSSDSRVRTLQLGAHLAPGRLDAVIDAYLTDGLDAALPELQRCIAEYMHVGSGSVTIESVDALSLT